MNQPVDPNPSHKSDGGKVHTDEDRAQTTHDVPDPAHRAKIAEAAAGEEVTVDA